MVRVVSLVLLATTAGEAQGTDSAGSALSLHDALRTAFGVNPSMRLAREQVRFDEGAVTIARSPFDMALRSSIAGGRADDLGFAQAGAFGSAESVASTRRQTMQYSLLAEKQFTNGVILAPSLSLSQVAQPTLSATAVNRAEAGVTAIVPLLRNRGGGVVAVQQRSAERALAASTLEQRQTAARTAAEVALAYWEYAAALERLAALRYAESRARTLVVETAEMVRGDARPKADLIQFRGNLASRRTQRVGAEQAVAQARQQLGIVLGIAPLEILALPPARLALGGLTVTSEMLAAMRTDSADVALADTSDADRAGREWAGRAVGRVLQTRPDVRAVQARRLAADDQVAAASNAMRAGVDLRVGVGMSGLSRGLAVSSVATPLLGNARGATLSVQLDYALPLLNLGARGAAAQAEAMAAQARTLERDRIRQVEAALAVAAAGLHRSRAALGDAALALQIAREVVENEKQKFRLGVSTQIDVVYAEDALTNALINDIATRAAYASAVAVLRLESGTLAAAGDDAAVLASLLSSDTNLWTTPQ